MADAKEGLLDALDDGPAPAPTPAPEPSPAPADAPAEAKAGTTEPKGEPKKPDPANSPERPKGYVPEQALREARDESRKEREARERAESNFQKFMDRYYADSAPKPEAPPAPPSVDEDPIGYIQHLAKQVESLSQGTAEQRQAAQAAAHEQQIVSTYVADAQAFAAEKPDFNAAYQHLLSSRSQELMAMGLTGPHLAAALKRDELAIVTHALQTRQRPAEVLYKMASVRGYSPAAPQAQQQPAADATPRDPATGQFTAAERAKQVAESQERNASLSQAPGAPVKRMTAKELGSMSEEEMWRHFEGQRRNKNFDREMNFRP